MVMVAIASKDLFGLVKINERVEDQKEGYQRALSEVRTNQIARYIDAGNAIPTNIVISFDEKQIKLSQDKKTISIKEGGNAGWVIDGQHRMGGASEATTNITLCVTGFIGLSQEQQISQFVTINKEAKKVPTSLYLDLLPSLQSEKSLGDQAKERAVDIVDQLREDEMSPFYNRIVKLKAPSKGQLSLTNFVRKVSPLLHSNTGILRNYAGKNQRAVLSNYFNALKDVFPNEFNSKESIFFKTLGFGAVMNAFPSVFNHTIKRSQNKATRAELARTLKAIETFSFAEWKKLGSSSSAEIIAGKDMTDALNEQMDDTNPSDNLEV